MGALVEDRPTRDFMILQYRVNGKSWEWIAEKYQLSVATVMSSSKWMLFNIKDKATLAQERRDFHFHRKAEKKRVKEEMATIRKELNQGVRQVKALMDKLIETL